MGRRPTGRQAEKIKQETLWNREKKPTGPYYLRTNSIIRMGNGKEKRASEKEKIATLESQKEEILLRSKEDSLPSTCPQRLISKRDQLTE